MTNFDVRWVAGGEVMLATVYSTPSTCLRGESSEGNRGGSFPASSFNTHIHRKLDIPSSTFEYRANRLVYWHGKGTVEQATGNAEETSVSPATGSVRAFCRSGILVCVTQLGDVVICLCVGANSGLTRSCCVAASGTRYLRLVMSGILVLVRLAYITHVRNPELECTHWLRIVSFEKDAILLPSSLERHQ